MEIKSSEGSIELTYEGVFYTIPKGKYSTSVIGNNVVLNYHDIGAIYVQLSDTIDGESFDTLNEIASKLGSFNRGGGSGTGAVESVTGDLVNISDPKNPIVDFPKLTPFSYLRFDAQGKYYAAEPYPKGMGLNPTNLSTGVSRLVAYNAVTDSFIASPLYSNSSDNNSIAQRSSTGTLVAANATSNNELVTYGQIRSNGTITPASLNISVNDATTTIPYVMNGAYILNGIQASRTAISNNIAIRTSTGQLKAASALVDEDLITLGQFNNTLKKNILPSDIGVTVDYAVPYKRPSQDLWSQIGLSQSVINDTLSQRTSTGQLKCNSAINSNEAIVLSQFQGIINNTLTSSETSTSLNALYSSNVIGTVVRSITNSVEYTKLTATQWKKETIVIV